MKLVVTYRPKAPPPPNMMADMFEGLAQWVGRYGPQFETLYFFAAGGGFGVIDIDDSAALQRMLAEHPFTVFADVEIRAVVDPQTALTNLQEAFAARGA